VSRIAAIQLLCAIQIRQLKEREDRLRAEIIDGQIQIEYLELLREDIRSINVLNYLKLDKTFYDEVDDEESEPEEI